jgi:hypothetical protein
MNTVLSLIILVLILAGAVVMLKKEKVIQSEKQPQSEKDKDVRVLLSDVNYIAPATFEVGMIKPAKCEFANNCNPGVLYPINGLSPDYESKMPDYCPCMEFIQAP